MSKSSVQEAGVDRIRNWAWARPAAALVLVLTVLALAALHTPTTSVAAGESGSSLAATASEDPSGAVAPTPTPVPDPPSYIVGPPSKGAYIGVFRPPVPFNSKPLTTYKNLVGKPAAMVMWFQPWSSKGANQFDTAAAVSVWKRGAIPIIAWEPWNPGDAPHNLSNPAAMPAWRLSNIAAGQYDAYIRSFADQIKAAGGPVMISLFHEMNGCWYPWGGTANGNTPADFSRAWRHVHDLFAQEGVRNVTWVWSINFESRPNTYANRFEAYYPGDQYVDWVGVSGFNWGQGVGGGPWKSFETIYRKPLRYLKTAHKPIMITEMASVENGGNKAAWLTNAFRRIRAAHPEIKAVIYYDAKERSHKHIQDWRINSSKKSLKAFKKAVASRSFVGGQPSVLTRWRNSLTIGQWDALLSIKRLY